MDDNGLFHIDFVERVAIEDEFLDALDYSRDALAGAMAGASGTALDIAVNVYPKLRFILLNLQRYIFASRFLRDTDRVLDIPCGTGYGAVVLASNGNHVLGIDIDDESIARASDMFRFPNVEFETEDMMTCSLPEVDFITCLDGLEHVKDGERLIQRLVGALSDDGILVVSVPINELKITGGQQNPYHYAEYDSDSLSKLLERYFGRVSLYGHDEIGTISDPLFAFDGMTAVCEV